MLIRGNVQSRVKKPIGHPHKHRRQAGSAPCFPTQSPSLGRPAFLFSLNSVTETSLSFEFAKTRWNQWCLLMVREYAMQQMVNSSILRRHHYSVHVVTAPWGACHLGLLPLTGPDAPWCWQRVNWWHPSSLSESFWTFYKCYKILVLLLV